MVKYVLITLAGLILLAFAFYVLKQNGKRVAVFFFLFLAVSLFSGARSAHAYVIVDSGNDIVNCNDNTCANRNQADDWANDYIPNVVINTPWDTLPDGGGDFFFTGEANAKACSNNPQGILYTLKYGSPSDPNGGVYTTTNFYRQGPDGSHNYYAKGQFSFGPFQLPTTPGVYTYQLRVDNYGAGLGNNPGKFLERIKTARIRHGYVIINGSFTIVGSPTPTPTPTPTDTISPPPGGTPYGTTPPGGPGGTPPPGGGPGGTPTPMITYCADGVNEQIGSPASCPTMCFDGTPIPQTGPDAGLCYGHCPSGNLPSADGKCHDTGVGPQAGALLLQPIPSVIQKGQQCIFKWSIGASSGWPSCTISGAGFPAGGLALPGSGETNRSTTVPGGLMSNQLYTLFCSVSNSFRTVSTSTSSMCRVAPSSGEI